jgi:hypothetical protein
MSKLYSPDESIETLRTKVTLLGWKTWCCRGLSGTEWYVDGPNESQHCLNPVEFKRVDKGGHVFFPSEEAALKAVLDYYASQQERIP